MVHGVGRHDRLSSLLEVFQAIRADLRSPEAPVPVEDSIPDWTLELFDEGANPPYLKLRCEYPGEAGDVTVVYLYEVNYSALAGVIRANHRLDLTTLFVGFDLAVCWSRQRQSPGSTTGIFPGDPAKLARSLQRVSGVMAAATGPLLGIPSMLLSRYSSSFVAAFTRFFEDVATYALDSTGEELISQHLDRICQNIHSSRQFTDPNSTPEFVMAAHSLGSVVTHSYLVRHWPHTWLPDRVVTFGSPIGIITWLWLFLDFDGFDFERPRPLGQFFAWSPLRSADPAVKPLAWINVLNCMDPIASGFPDDVADLARHQAEIQANLIGHTIAHRYLGPAKLSETGRSHTAYIHDSESFLEILRCAAGLGPKNKQPGDIPGDNREGHWRATGLVLGHAKVLAWWTAMFCITAYCALIAWHFDSDWAIVAAAVLYCVPPLTVGLMAFVQRFVFGVRTKRISRKRILELKWDVVSLPYRLRQWLDIAAARALGGKLPAEEEQETVPAPNPWIRRFRRVVAFVPTLAMMSVSVVAGITRNGWPHDWPTAQSLLLALALFVLYLMSCAVYVLVSAWRTVLADLDLTPPAQS